MIATGDEFKKCKTRSLSATFQANAFHTLHTFLNICTFKIGLEHLYEEKYYCCESKPTTETLELSLSANPLLISSNILPSHLTKFDQFPVYLIQTFGVN